MPEDGNIQVHGRLRTDPDALTLLSGVSLEEGDVGAEKKTPESQWDVSCLICGGVMKRQNYKIALLSGISTGLEVITPLIEYPFIRPFMGSYISIYN